MNTVQVALTLVVWATFVISDVTSQQNGIPEGRDYHIPEGTSQTLNCSQSGSPLVVTWTNVTWILPNLTLIQRDHDHVFVDGTTFSLSEDGEILEISNILSKWYGDYYCIVLHQQQNFYVTKFGVNSSFVYDAELYEHYQRIILILAVLCGSVLALLTLLFTGIVWCRRSVIHAQRRNLRISTSDGATDKSDLASRATLGHEVTNYSYPNDMVKQSI